MSEEKLTKKQRKALEFRSKLEKLPKPEKRSLEEEAPKSDEKTGDEPEKSEEPTPKKRKTRRGKKGKGVNGGKGPRFILFVGNLPFDIKEPELVSHFKNSNPDRIRVRQDKGIAFLEFDNDTREIQSKMEVALRMHHTVLRNRKINVELTVGGGGNSENRKSKLKEKNEKLVDERRTRVKSSKSSESSAELSGVHPSRAKLMH